MSLRLKKENLNHFGYCHGGYILALFDMTSAISAISVRYGDLKDIPPARVASFTADASYKFIGSLREGDTIVLRTKSVTKMGDRYYVNTEVYKNNEVLVGVGSNTTKLIILPSSKL